MSVAVSPYNVPQTSRLESIRATGGLWLDARRDGAVTAIQAMHEHGGYRLKCPEQRADPLEAIMINTGGGVAGGDRIAIASHARARSRLSLTTATAERVYRSDGATTEIDIALTVEDGATLAWLPQATILFSGSMVRRKLSADVAAQGRVLIVETTAFGRAASGETLDSGMMVDRWLVHRGGRVVFAEAMKLDGDMAAALGRNAVAADATISSLLLCVSPDAEHRRDAMRSAFAASGLLAGVSAWNGLLVARVLATRLDHMANALRHAVAALDIIPLPRAWTH